MIIICALVDLGSQVVKRSTLLTAIAYIYIYNIILCKKELHLFVSSTGSICVFLKSLFFSSNQSQICYFQEYSRNECQYCDRQKREKRHDR